MHKKIIYVPNYGELKNSVLKEMHNVWYVGYPTYQKTLQQLEADAFG